MTKEYKFHRHLSEEHRAKISSALQGRKLPQEVKDKIATSLRKAWATIPKDNVKSDIQNNKQEKDNKNG